MIDIAKQVEFWRAGSVEDFAVASDLIAREKIRHGLFFLHLSLEKALKAEVCRVTRDVPPRIHNLARLAELARLEPSREQLVALGQMNEFNIEGRYPQLLSPAPTSAEAQHHLARAEEILKWLSSQ